MYGSIRRGSSKQNEPKNQLKDKSAGYCAVIYESRSLHQCCLIITLSGLVRFISEISISCKKRVVMTVRRNEIEDNVYTTGLTRH